MDYVLKKGLKSVAIVGMAKNVGKTVTLNHLIKKAEQEGLSIGLTSIGRDGERIDALTAMNKPQINIVSGTLFATAQAALEKTGLRAEVIADTGISTILGRVYIYRAMEDGEVELVGPHSHFQLKRVIKMMESEVDLILIDGAINRSSSAAPSLTDAVILATGAAVGPDIKTVVEKTAYQAGCFKLPQVEDKKILEMGLKLVNKNKSGLIDEDYNLISFEMPTALLGIEKIRENITERTKALVLSGALTEGLLTELEAEVGNIYDLEIIIQDGTRIFLEPKTFNRFLSRGGKICVVKPIKLIAVTVNSTNPQGVQLNPDELCTALARHLKNIPIFDLMLSKSILIGRSE